MKILCACVMELLCVRVENLIKKINYMEKKIVTKRESYIYIILIKKSRVREQAALTVAIFRIRY